MNTEHIGNRPAPAQGRRGFLGAAGALAGTTLLASCTAAAPMPALASVHPDAELIALCEGWLMRMREFERVANAIPSREVGDDHPAWTLIDETDALEHRIIGVQPVTAEGYVARLRCAAFMFLPGNRHLSDDTDLSFDDRVTRATLRDLVAGRA